MNKPFRALGLGALALLLSHTPTHASFHTYDVNELFSNASGTVQFVEMREAAGLNGQNLFSGHQLTSNTMEFTFLTNLPSSATAGTFILLATAGFAALPGAPTPDYILPDNFFAVTGDTVTLVPVDALTFGAVPTDGINSLNRNLTTGTNSPTNFAGVTGSVDLSAPATPPAVPDGVSGPGVLVDRTTLDGSQLVVTFDTATCEDAQNHQIVYGGGSQLPTAFDGGYTLDGAECAIGAGSPFSWLDVPDPEPATSLLWFVVLATDDASTEGAWGENSGGLERTGPAGDGSSAQCGIRAKDLANTCGQ